MPDNKPYLLELRVQNVGPHENGMLQICMGEKGPFKIGIFSTNGSGKTSLSRQFRLLRIQSDLIEGDKLPLSDKFLSIGENTGKFKFKFYEQDSAIKEEFEIKHNRGNEPIIENNAKFIFHIFNSDYVKETIEPNNYGADGSINGYIIGKEEVDVSKEKKELSEERKKYKLIKDDIISEIEIAKKSLKKAGIRTNTKEYKELSFENLFVQNDVNESEKLETLITKLKKLENIPEDLKDIPNIKAFSYEFENLKNIISELKKVLTPSSISKEFKNKIKNKEDFIELGLASLKESNRDICPFCEQELKEQQLGLIDQYVEYFEDAETKFKNDLDGYKEKFSELNSLLQEKHNEILRIEKAYNKLSDYFPSFSDSSIKVFDDPKTKFDWELFNTIIEDKKESISKPIEQEKITQIENAIDSIRKYTTNDVEKKINSGNSLIKSINSTKNHTNNEVLSLKKRICKAQYISLKNTLEKSLKSLETKEKIISSINKTIEKAENKARYPKKEKVTDEFRRLLKFIFNDKYIFDEKENCLKFKNHLLRNSAEDILSDGEKSVIAFCYFLAEVHRIVDKEIDYDKLFLIIDDPVSSMDFHFTYSISNLLGDLERAYESLTSKNLKLIILTHNLEFMSILSRNNVLTRGGYVLTPGAINKLNKELIMPYQEHLMDVYKVAEKGFEPNHTTPNSMRHILETINKFECPGNNYSLKQFISDHEKLKSCSGIHTLIQDGSHGYIRDQSAMTSAQVRKGCKTIIDFITLKYARQIEHIKSSVKN